MKCPRCQNTEPLYFYKGSKGWICRRCIQFRRQCLLDEVNERDMGEISEKAEEYLLNYPLTSKQKEISRECILKIQQGTDVFIDAICGAGKTEIVIESIYHYLKNKKRVAFAVARRQVVLDLYGRLKGIFKNAKVIAVCQGYTDDLEGDLIICTTHQLYRYPKTFDLLILDEPDAFPYKGNVVLEGIVKTSCKGRMIYLTATPDALIQSRIKKGDIAHLKLFRRPHNHDLVVPKQIRAPTIVLVLILLRWIREHKESALVFSPTIQQAKRLKMWVSLFYSAEVCTSKTENKDEIIQGFKNKKYDCLIATTILERGVTIEGVDVCIFHAHNGVFDEASLIQMSGRVGRSFAFPTGDCLFLLSQKSELVERCICQCKEVNQHG